MNIALFVIILIGYAPISYSHDNGISDWEKSGNDPVVYLHADGQIVRIQNNKSKKFLKQGYEARNDAKRNVEAGVATGGPDWIFQRASRGHWFIINLKTGLYLTKDGDDKNVSNWGRMDRHKSQEWRVEFKQSRGFQNQYTPMYIINKATNTALAQSGDNVGVWGGANLRNPAREWLFMKTPGTTNYKSLLKLTIVSVKAINTSTGQDGATKVLFSGIDLAIDLGMAAATGGASAGAKTAAKAALKGGTRAVSRSAVMAAAKAAARDAIKDGIKEKLKEKAQEGLLYGLSQTELDAKARNALASAKNKSGYQKSEDAYNDYQAKLSESTEALLVASDVLEALSSEAIFNKVYPSSPDDLEIGVNGSSIYPNGGRDYRKISSQQRQSVDKRFIFKAEDGLDIHLIEYDYASDNDSLGWVHWNVPKHYYKWLKKFQKSDGTLWFNDMIVSNKSEGSLYEITFKITPVTSYLLSQGLLNKTKIEQDEAASQCVDKIFGACYTYASIYLRTNQEWKTSDSQAKRLFGHFQHACERESNQRACKELVEVRKEGCKDGRQWICELVASAERYEKLRLKNIAAEKAFKARSDIRQEKLIGCNNGENNNCYLYASLLFEDAKTIEKGAASLGGVYAQKQRMWPESADVFNKLCNLSYEDSCERLHDVYSQSCKFGTQESCLALEKIKKDKLTGQCDRGNPNSCYDLANILDTSLNQTPNDRDFAENLYIKACKGAVAGSCSKLLEVSVTSCKQGKASSCQRQALDFLYGSSAHPIDLPRARQYFTYGCQYNHIDSCINLGIMLRDGQGGAVEKLAAQESFNKTCSLGDSYGCFEYAQLMLENKSDDEKMILLDDAIAKYTQACQWSLDAGCDKVNELKDWSVSYFKAKETNQPILGNQNSSVNSQNRQNEVLHCSQLGQVVSQAGVATNILINNTGTTSVYVYWVGYKGQEQDYKGTQNPLVTIAAGQSMTISSAIGAVHSIYDNNSCLSVVKTSQANQNFTTGSQATQPNNQTQDTTTYNNYNNANSQPSGTNSNAAQNTLSCDQIGQVISVAGEATNLFINNTGTTPLYVYWIGYQGKEQDYQGTGNPLVTIAAGQSMTISSAIGAVHSIYDNNACLSVVKTSQPNQTFTTGSQTTQSNNQTQDSTTNDTFNSQTTYTNTDTSQNASSCSQLGQVVSQQGEVANLLINNTGTTPIYVYWIGYQGKEQDYQGTGNPLVTIASGQSMTISSAIGAVHSIYDENSCLSVVKTSQLKQSISIRGNY